jgi:hypothetical protein
MVLLVTLSSVTSAQEVRVRVTAPPHGAEVPERPFIEGTVSHPKAVVWVIVHPMAVSDYWVQPATHVSEDGRWKVQIYIGRPGSIDVGKRFQVMAIANPKQPLKEGNVLKDWPAADARSQALEVVRK